MTILCFREARLSAAALFIVCSVWLAFLAVGLVALHCCNGSLKKRLHLCQVHMSQELCHVVKVMFVILALCEYLQEVLVISSIFQRATGLGHIWFTFKLLYIINTSPLARSNCFSFLKKCSVAIKVSCCLSNALYSHLCMAMLRCIFSFLYFLFFSFSCSGATIS